jgi:hypothetical protein
LTSPQQVLKKVPHFTDELENNDAYLYRNIALEPIIHFIRGRPAGHCTCRYTTVSASDLSTVRRCVTSDGFIIHAGRSKVLLQRAVGS